MINVTQTSLESILSNNNNTGNLNHTFHNHSLVIFYTPSRLGTALGAIVAFTFILFGLIGDLLITISILSKKELRNNLVNIFIVSLQINDIFNIGFNQFFVGLAYAYMKWTGPLYICDIVVYTSIICTGSLLWHHALIAIHRYLVVVCNQTTYYMGMSPKVYVILSLIIARLIPSLVCSPAFLKKMTEYSPSALRCMLAPKISAFQNLLIVVILMLIPCIIVVFCFLRIFTRVHNVSKNIRAGMFVASNHTANTNTKDDTYLQKSSNQQLTPNHKNNTASNSLKANKKLSSVSLNEYNTNATTMRREIQITKMFAIIFTVFLFGYLPYGIIRLIDKSNSLHPDYYILLTVLFIISISVSPIIYGLMNTQIRTQCVVIIQSIYEKISKKNKNAINLKQRKSTSTQATALPNSPNKNFDSCPVSPYLMREKKSFLMPENVEAKLLSTDDKMKIQHVDISRKKSQHIKNYNPLSQNHYSIANDLIVDNLKIIIIENSDDDGGTQIYN